MKHNQPSSPLWGGVGGGGVSVTLVQSCTDGTTAHLSPRKSGVPGLRGEKRISGTPEIRGEVRERLACRGSRSNSHPGPFHKGGGTIPLHAERMTNDGSASL